MKLFLRLRLFFSSISCLRSARASFIASIFTSRPSSLSDSVAIIDMSDVIRAENSVGRDYGSYPRVESSSSMLMPDFMRLTILVSNSAICSSYLISSSEDSVAQHDVYIKLT